ncbi:tetratricopeptide repeat protein, partial [Thermodesulfobacteriota bacterium]
MTEDRVKRKLSAILSADVEGYSRLMGEDEVATVHTLESYRKVMAGLIDQYRGRVVDSPGDNLLAEFSSVVDAVQCAVEILEVLKAKNQELPENRRMLFRIGVNLGDVIEEGDRIYGDGVNIAARLESLAEAGGICISGSAHEQIKNKLALGYEYIGEHSVKNIADPLKVYRVPMGSKAMTPKDGKEKKAKLKKWQWAALGAVVAVLLVAGAFLVWNFYLRGPSIEPASIEPASIERMAYPLPDKPSIAVLSFRNMSGDPTQEYIGDGISENITSALSKIGGMFVIARESVFIYKKKPAKIQQVAEELGVQYVLEGSVQKSGDRLRVTAQLIDALTGHHLWSEKYDREMRDLFELQDEITKRIAVSLHVELMRGGEVLIEARSTDNLEAWSKAAKGYHYWARMTKEDNEKAQQFYKEAVKFDPNYVAAWSMLAWALNMYAGSGWSESPFESMKLAQEAHQKALSIDDQHPYVINYQGFRHLVNGEYSKAIAEIKRAITIDPNYFGGYIMLANTMFVMGRFQESLDLYKKAMRLCPYYPQFVLNTLGRTYFFMGRYEEAIEIFNQHYDRCKNGECPEWTPLIYLAMVYAELGKKNEARVYIEEALKNN